MDVVRNSNVMSCVRIIFWSIADGYVITTDLQGFIPQPSQTPDRRLGTELMESPTLSPATVTFLLPSGPGLLGIFSFSVVGWCFFNHLLHRIDGSAKVGFQKPSFPFWSLISCRQLGLDLKIFLQSAQYSYQEANKSAL